MTTLGEPGLDSFAHLHLHTAFSLLDGAIRMGDLCGAVLARGMKSVAVTDHGNLFGAVQFYQQAKEHGVKPIFGAEVYVSEQARDARADRKNHHLVLLARNRVGYENLRRLVSKAWTEGFYYQPRIDRALLREHREGLIGLSACTSGHVARHILAKDMDQARERVLEYRDIFEPGMWFLELQPNGSADQELVNAALAELGRSCDVPLVATNDCHYLDPSEAHAHRVLKCMGLQRTLDDPLPLKHEAPEYFLKRPGEMEGYFRQYPDALANACRIPGMCDVELRLGRPELPQFQLPAGRSDLPAYLREVAREGLQRRLVTLRARGKQPDEEVYRARLEFELGVIEAMDFPGYFLIVWDFIRKAKELGIPVGPGRGSGAGSLVAYSLGITDLDPLAYDLLFERFLNPERVSMPDFDIDFCMDRRGEVIDYVTERYGRDRVGQIATFHSLKARGLVRDVCRVSGWSVADTNDLAKLVPEGPKVTLSGALADPDALKQKIEKDPASAGKLKDKLAIAEAAGRLRERVGADERAREVLDVGVKLEGLYRHAGMHAAGVVIGNRPLWDCVPVFTAEGTLVTQYTMNDVEPAGLVKFDFLGLKTLTVIQTAVRLVRDAGLAAPDFDLDAVPMDDAAVFELISRGDTTGVFQLESSGFKDLLKRLRPDCFEDIIAAVALYRPGPLEGGMVDQFIECKHGRRAIEYPHPMLEDVLRETYGVFVYQEQVMQAAQVLAGFTLGAADLMRRAMGKKKAKEMEQQRALFVEGCKAHNGIAETLSNEVFDLIDKFAGYGFNKSHSAAYGLITYQTAYLKAHFPVAFMAALMTCDSHNNDNVVKFIAEARAMGLDVLAPDVNESEPDFSVVAREQGGHAIRFGLGAVRGVGEGAVDAVIAARRDGGAFASLFDLCRRVDLRRANKRTLEGLVCAGAFDGIGRDAAGAPLGRARLVAAIDAAVEQGQGAQRDRESGQRGLFDLAAAPEAVYVEEYPEVEPWTAKERLQRERESLGLYVTGHPLDRFAGDIARFATTNVGRLSKDMAGQEVVIGGVICDLREVQTRSGKGAMGFFQLEDPYGRIETVCFPKTWSKQPETGGPALCDVLPRLGDEPALITGKLEAELDDDGEVRRFKLLLEQARSLGEVRRERTTELRLRLRDEQLAGEGLARLEAIARAHPGPCPIALALEVPGSYVAELRLDRAVGVAAEEATLIALERSFGEGCAELA
jgi:DNA polymerase-3 subunit alpha